ncbi:hypothetical protein [Serratia nevei]|nr:hypothetical protein [Serratia nevei]
MQQTTFSDGSTLNANISMRPFAGVAAPSLHAKLANGRTLDVAP